MSPATRRPQVSLRGAVCIALVVLTQLFPASAGRLFTAAAEVAARVSTAAGATFTDALLRSFMRLPVRARFCIQLTLGHNRAVRCRVTEE